MLTAQLMAAMDDGHLLAAIRAEHDPMTSTAIEDEMLARFERLVDAQHDNEGVRALIAEYSLAADDMRAVIESHPASLADQAALLSLLNDQDIHEPDQLKALIERVDAFSNIANDAGDVIARLSQLITTVQE